MSGAFNQLILDDDSAKLLVLNTERGLMASRRLSFGVKTASALFQSCMDKVLAGLNNVFCYIIDNILIVTSSLEEHTQVLSEVFDRLEQFNVRLNPNKCEFYKGEVKYLGHRLNADGVQPLLSKVETIQKARRPENVSVIFGFGQFLWEVWP